MHEHADEMRTHKRLKPTKCDSTSRRTETARSTARVVVCVRVLVDVVGVMVVVLIAHVVQFTKPFL